MNFLLLCLNTTKLLGFWNTVDKFLGRKSSLHLWLSPFVGSKIPQIYVEYILKQLYERVRLNFKILSFDGLLPYRKKPFNLGRVTLSIISYCNFFFYGSQSTILSDTKSQGRLKL